MGFGVMAVTGCFAGQLFNLLIGFGLALVQQTSSQSYDLSLFDGSSATEWITNGIAISILVFTIVSTAVTFIVVKRLSYRLEKGWFSSYLVTYYVIAIAVCLGFCIAD